MTALKLAAAGAAATAMLLSAAPAGAQQTIRTATSWPGGVHLEQFAQGFSKQADALTGGKVKFQIFPAGTIGSPLKITESVQKKVAQAGHSLARLRLGHRQGRGDLRRLRRIAAGRGAPALGLRRRRHRPVARVAPGEVRRGRHSRAAPTRTRSTCIRRKPIRTIEDLKGLKLQHLGCLGRGCNQPRRLDRHPAGRRGLSRARARRRRRHRMGDARHQHRARLPQGRQVHHPARRASAGRRARVRLRQERCGTASTPPPRRRSRPPPSSRRSSPG